MQSLEAIKRECKAKEAKEAIEVIEAIVILMMINGISFA